MANKIDGVYLAFLHLYSYVSLGKLISLRIRTSVDSIITGTRKTMREKERETANPRI